MPFAFSITRRQAIVGAATTMVSARLLGMQTPSISTTSGSQKTKNSLSTLLDVTHPTSTDFDSLLNKHFPGLASLPNFASIRPFVLIVKNKTAMRVRALNATWTLTSTSGRVTRHSYAYFFRPSRLKKYSQSGQLSVIGSQQFCVISPLFCWTPKRFEKAAGPRTLVALLQSHPSENLLAFDAVSAQSLTGRLDAAIDAKGILVGSGKTGLGKRYAATRNAEHDEALLLLTDRDSTPGKTLKATLVEHQAQKPPLGPHASYHERIYYKARMRFAKLAHRALRETDEYSVQTILDGVKNTPPTILSRRSTRA